MYYLLHVFWNVSFFTESAWPYRLAQENMSILMPLKTATNMHDIKFF